MMFSFLAFCATSTGARTIIAEKSPNIAENECA